MERRDERSLRPDQEILESGDNNLDTRRLTGAMRENPALRRKAAIAKGLLRIGGAEANEGLDAMLTPSRDAKITEAVLDGIAEEGIGGFKEVVLEALQSDSRKVRMKAIHAAKRMSGDADIDQELERARNAASTEEQYLIDRAGR